MSEQNNLENKLRNPLYRKRDVEVIDDKQADVNVEDTRFNPAVYQLGYTDADVESEVAQAEQQTASIDEIGEISALANQLDAVVKEYQPRSIGVVKTLDANFKRMAEHQKESNEKIVEAFQKKASEPREIDISDKKAPEEKSFLEKIKDTIASSCGIAKNILFETGKAIVKPVGAGVIKMVSSPVGAGIAAGAGIATVGAGVAYVASRNPKGIIDPRWLEGINKSKVPNDKLASLLSKYWTKHGGPNNPEKISWFIGSVAGETGMRNIREYGDRKYFVKYGPQTKVGKKLGNLNLDDAYRFRGGGLIQLTGRDNYENVAKEMGLRSAEELESRISDLDVGVESAVIYFLKRPGMSKSARSINAKDFKGALRGVGLLGTRPTQEFNIRDNARKTFMQNVNNYPSTAPDYNNGIATETNDGKNPLLPKIFKKNSGLEYSWDRRTSNTAADCSSLVDRLIYDITKGEVDYRWINTQGLVQKGESVSVGNIAPGDLVFWNRKSKKTGKITENGHVEMYAGNGQTFGTNTPGQVSRYRGLNENGRQSKITAIRRIKKVYNIINA